MKSNPSIFSGKLVDEIAQVLKDSGYDVTVKASTRSRSGAQIIKISTTDQGIIKIIDGSESLYKTDGQETATIEKSGGICNINDIVVMPK